MGLSWFSLRPSRLETGLNYNIFNSAGLVPAIALISLWVLCLFFSIKASKLFSLMLGISANGVLITSFLIINLGTGNLIRGSPDSARVSPGIGLWLTFLACYIIIFAAAKRVHSYKIARSIIIWTGPAALAFFIFSGSFDNLSIMLEYYSQRARFYQEFLNHIYLVAVGVSIGSFLGISLGILAVLDKKIKNFVFFITSITQTIPSLALFGLLIVPLSALSFRFETLREMGIRGIGNAPAIIALVIYSLLPVVRNTYAGMVQVEPSTKDAARGIGMSRIQIFRRIEVPLAAPIVMEGIRIASVQSVGLAVVASLIGAGGLGWFIFQGLGQAAPDMILFGTIPVIFLAIFTDKIMRLIIRLAAGNKSKGGQA